VFAIDGFNGRKGVLYFYKKNHAILSLRGVAMSSAYDDSGDAP
jgi:hypothetical protein